MRRKGVRSVALTEETLRVDPKLWDRVDRAEFSVIYATPEVLLHKKSHFSTETIRPEKRNKFKDNLVLIALDEAHCVWDWESFRKAFKYVGSLRLCFAQVPFTAVSATFPPHVVAYAHKVLKMKRPACIITVNGRRANIDVMVAIQPPGKSHQPLLDLIPETISAPEEIPKTLIFVDDVLEALSIAKDLRIRFRKHFRSRFKSYKAIRTYYSSIDDPKKAETISFIRGGEARIVVCTDALSLGVDIPDIERVIQWGVDYKLVHNTLVQRIGRAARNPEMNGIAVIYAPKCVLEPVSKAASQQPESDEPSDDDEMGGDLDNNAEPGTVPNYRNRDLAKFSLPVEQKTLKEIQQLREHMYLRAKNLKNADLEAQAEQRGRTWVLSEGGKRKNRKPVDRIEPGILWFLNTKGCRNRQILSYLDYPDVFNDAAQRGWCCDNCAVNRKLDPEMTSTAGIKLTSSALLSCEVKAK